MRKLPIAGDSAYDIVPALRVEETAMTHTRPFDPALFREAAIDAETAKLNAQMIELLTDQPDCGRRGFPGRAPARRRPVPGPGDVEPGANSGDPRQGRQRNSPAGNRTGAAARDLSASPRRRLGAGRRGHAGSDAGADRRRYGSGHCRRRISAGAGTPLSSGPGRLRGCCRLADTERQERVRH